MRNVPPDVTDFPSLIRWLAHQYHGGSYYPMAARLKCAPAAIYKWRDGMARPKLDTVAKFCEVYDLDITWLIRLVRQSVASVLLALTTLATVPAAAGPLPMVAPHADSEYYVNRRRRPRRPRTVRSAQWRVTSAAA